jgi:hypothetical protein
MNDHEHYKPDAASAVQLCRLWSVRVDALERHLSANTWALAVAVVVFVYPIARIVIPALLQVVVPDAVRTVLNLI